jgi:Family of unknown function (DUF6338)
VRGGCVDVPFELAGRSVVADEGKGDYGRALAAARALLRSQLDAPPRLLGWALLTTAIVEVLAGLPAAAGTWLGRLYAMRRHDRGSSSRLLRLVLGPHVAPRAWDHFFSARPSTYLRIRTVDGTLHGGMFASRSYAGGYPHDPDLLLEQAWQVDARTGQLLASLGYPLYLAAGQIAWMEIVPPATPPDEGHD